MERSQGDAAGAARLSAEGNGASWPRESPRQVDNGPRPLPPRNAFVEDNRASDIIPLHVSSSRPSSREDPRPPRPLPALLPHLLATQPQPPRLRDVGRADDLAPATAAASSRQAAGDESSAAPLLANAGAPELRPSVGKATSLGREAPPFPGAAPARPHARSASAGDQENAQEVAAAVAAAMAKHREERTNAERRELARGKWLLLLRNLSDQRSLTPAQERWAVLRERLPEVVRKLSLTTVDENRSYDGTPPTSPGEGQGQSSGAGAPPTAPAPSRHKKAPSVVRFAESSKGSGSKPRAEAVQGQNQQHLRQQQQRPAAIGRFPKSGSLTGSAPPSNKSFIAPLPARGPLSSSAGTARTAMFKFPRSGSSEAPAGDASVAEEGDADTALPKISVGSRTRSVATSENLRSSREPGLPTTSRNSMIFKPGFMQAGVQRRFGGLKRGQSVIMCMDPNCNQCPPEMHMHRFAGGNDDMAKPAQEQAKAKKQPKFKVEDLDLLDLEEDDDSPGAEMENARTVVTMRCCGFKITFRPPSLRALLPPVFNPHNKYVRMWTRLLLYVSLVSFLVDPWFLYSLSFSDTWYCAYTKWGFLTGLVVVRTLIDAFTLANMVLYSRLAFKATQANVRTGKIRNSWGERVKVGELVIADEKAILLNYCRRFLLLDLLTLLPYPQIIYLGILPQVPGIDVSQTGIVVLRLSALLQCIPRLLRIIPVVSGTQGYQVFESPWFAFVLNLFTFLTTSHIIGAIWFLLTEQRVAECLLQVCAQTPLRCNSSFLSCPAHGAAPSTTAQNAWIKLGTGNKCYLNTEKAPVDFGIYLNGVPAVYLSEWFNQWLYSIMWGFQQVSTFGGNLVPTTNYGEVVFMIVLVSLGLFLFALLIGNMQNFLQSLSRRITEYQMKMRDLGKWMEQKDMPRDLQKRIRTLEQYCWTANQGVEEEALMSSLTEDIQRDVRRHLFLQPIKKCHLLSVMHSSVLDAICERLRSRQFIDGTEIIREGTPVCRMFFVVRGALESVTTAKGRTGFFERVVLGKGDFFGEELLVHFIEKYAGENPYGKKRRSLRRDVGVGSALMRGTLPRSERAVRCLGPVDGFSLEAEDIDYVCTQFYKDMQADEVQRALNACSMSRRTRGATTIQVWWRALLRRRLDIPFDVHQQALRTRRLGMLIRSAREIEGGALLDDLPDLLRRATKDKKLLQQQQQQQQDGAQISTPRPGRKVSWLGLGSSEASEEFPRTGSGSKGLQRAASKSAAALAAALMGVSWSRRDSDVVDSDEDEPQLGSGRRDVQGTGSNNSSTGSAGLGIIGRMLSRPSGKSTRDTASNEAPVGEDGGLGEGEVSSGEGSKTERKKKRREMTDLERELEEV